MKFCKSYLFSFLIILGFNTETRAVDFGSIIEVVKTTSELVKVGIGISSIGVALWGSEDVQKKFSKIAGYINLSASLGSGDFDGAIEAAKDMAEKHKAFLLEEQKKEKARAEEALALIAEGHSNLPTRGTASAVGDIKTVSDQELKVLQGNKRTISINDLKIANAESMINHVVFETAVPQLGKKMLLVLPNKESLVLETRELELGLRSTSPYRENPSQYLQVVIHQLQTVGKNNILKELGSMAFTKKEFAQLKNIWCDITNNSFSIFHMVGNKIMLSTFIKFPKK